MSDISARIKLFEDIARSKAALRKRFLAEREQNQTQTASLARSAQPIVEPIVEAIKREQPPSPVITLGDGELEALINQISDGFEKDRTTLTKTVREMYNNKLLFNVLLSLVKLNIISEFPIKKMSKFGLVDSILFYAQGGHNLDLIPAYRQTLEYKERKDSFDKFYSLHSKRIARLHQDSGTDDADSLDRLWTRARAYSSAIDSSIAKRAQRQLPEIPISDDDDDDDDDLNAPSSDSESVEGDDTLVEGEGLGDRLAVLHASRNAGNTSLEVLNEAGNIMKQLLKAGKITKKQYVKLGKLFSD